MKKLTRIGVALLGVIYSVQLLFSASASAAGNIVVSVEASANPVMTGQTFDLRFYATPSGENVYGVSVMVNLTNLSFSHYDTAGTPFNGYSGVPAGGSSGSTSFEVAASYQGASSGGSGKLYMGKAVVVASSSAGVGQVTLSNVQAFDPTLDPMSGSVQNTSVTINAPAQPPATCPSGQTGTPPNCTTPTSGGGGGSTTPPPSSGTNNPTVNPNSSSNATLPNSSSSDPTTSGEVVSENEISEMFMEGRIDRIPNTGPGDDGITEDGTPVLVRFALWSGGALILMAMAGAALALRAKRNRPELGLSSPGVYSVNNDGPTNTDVTPSSDSTTNPNHMDPPEPPSDNGPNIIYPR